MMNHLYFSIALCLGKTCENTTTVGREFVLGNAKNENHDMTNPKSDECAF